MTPFEFAALRALNDAPDGLPTSGIGYKLWELSDPVARKQNPSPQGMALFAGRFCHSLYEQGYILPRHGGRGWRISSAGKAVCE